MLLAGRHESDDSYRYGFQACPERSRRSQEKDDEIKGEANSINYKFRMHSLSRRCRNRESKAWRRFFAVDPLASEYPWFSPYQFSGNRLVDKIELEGLEPTSVGLSNLSNLL